jgi:Flp pilus assembly protein TadG
VLNFFWGTMAMGTSDKIRAIAARAARSGFIARIFDFSKSTRANVAMIFGLSLIPLTIAAGTGLDLARGMLVHAQLITALDAAALAVGGTPGLSQDQMQQLAQKYFNANYSIDKSFGNPNPVTVTVNGQSVNVSCNDPMPTTLLNVIGYKSLNVKASSTVVWGQQKLWVGLALDNTGSMTQADKNGVTKIAALKSATHSLLNMLQSVALNPGDVQVSIVPFARDVKIGANYSGAVWLSWTDWLSAPTPAPSNSVGPGSNCPYSDYSNGFHCQTTPTNGSSSTNTIPSSGTYKGYICPSVSTVGHYYNGCWNSTSTGTGKYTHTWIANNKNTWTGCVMDRTQDYDTTNTNATISNPGTLFSAENSPSCAATSLLGLNYNWTSLNNEVDAMSANGSTNQTIGLVWAWQTMTTGAPLNAPTLPEETQPVVILLSDGLNTQDRWYGDGSNQSTQVDGRMAIACSNIKAAGITVYTVFVDLNGTQGNSTVLQNCASDPSKYFDLTSADQIVTTFNQIGEQITNLRVAG